MFPSVVEKPGGVARVGTAINDPNYARNTARFLDYAREHAVLSDGMVKSRWKYDAGDAQAGTYDDKNGFYEAQWGRLMDSQTSYVTNVADQFDQTGDKAWVARQKESCESALEYLLRRDKDGDALVEMENSLTAQRRSSDWLDIVWASHENALVNGQLYGALLKWGAVERLLGDEKRAARYLDFAARLKASFNRTIAEGGFWNPAKGWYVYWRDADDSVHGDNLVMPVNLTALADGICDEPVRRKGLLDTIETRMNAESLVTWPSCFTSYQPGEGADDVFPKYENGDVFLAWAEYGVRAYAATQPEIALKYVRRIVDQYKRDGLAYQRYLRASGQGAGDDILANNGNVITGLYRDIYGIQPKYNRLLLAPNISSELDGTRVRYDFRGKPLVIDLSIGDYRVTHGAVTIGGAGPFGVDFGASRFTYFGGEGDKPAFTVQSPAGSPLTLKVEDWSTRKRWTVASGPQSLSMTIAFSDLVPGRKYSVVASGKPVGTVSASQPSVNLRCAARASIDFDLLPRSAE
ncbi:hypothetical protein EON81_20275 [bacterium]|nr:MAG: hypothetical protein EON81_20275 [bacterium]